MGKRKFKATKEELINLMNKYHADPHQVGLELGVTKLTVYNNLKRYGIFQEFRKGNFKKIEPNHIEIIKYQNRKLYSIFFNRYTTLNEIEYWISKGKTVSVIEFSQKNDITSEILTKVYGNLLLKTIKYEDKDALFFKIKMLLENK